MYLGLYGSKRSQDRYKEFVARLLAEVEAPAPPATGPMSVAEAAEHYLDYAKARYSDHEYRQIAYSLGPFLELWGSVPTSEIAPAHLTACQAAMVKRKWARTLINQRIRRIVRFIRHASQRGHAPPTLYHSLLCVEPLRAGQLPDSYERPKREGVPWAKARELLPFLAPPIAGLVTVQYFAGLRPCEAVALTLDQIDRNVDPWLYRPAKHKGSWRGKALVKAIPRIAQEVIAKASAGKALDAPLFAPRDAVEWKEAEAAKTRHEARTPVYPCEAKRRATRHRWAIRDLRPAYSVEMYAAAIRYGFQRAKKAGVHMERWTPYQLRHGVATEIAEHLGVEAAQRWLGHAHLNTTEIYAARTLTELSQIASALDSQLWSTPPDAG